MQVDAAPDSRSLRSVGSVSSMASAASLSRKPRTRARSKTITSPGPGQELPESPSFQVRFVAEPGPSSKAARHAASLPGINTANAFSRVESPNIRDSVLTQDSTSSSLYPLSTSTASGTESPPSPRSVIEVGIDVPVVDEPEEFDGDDVSYRLQLLVKNSYFLPPAHSKPKPSDFSSNVTPKKSPTPGFLDIFRKSKSRPTTPAATTNQTFDLFTPALRTTSDATMVTGYQPRTPSSQAPQTSRTSSQQPSVGRVVVVREKMADLAVAAKQAEQEMTLRAVRRGDIPLPDPTDAFDDVIDPTDAVDLPPPSSGYPFAVQASALHGLGVQDSLGAALLADRLPPPNSPGAFDADGDWRTQLLQAAVGHSFDNLQLFPSPAASPMPSPMPPGSPLSDDSHLLNKGKSRSIGKRIISNPIVEGLPDDATPTTTGSPTTTTRSGERLSNSLHIRVASPPVPLMPLTPPPRRQLINPLYSLSQTDLPVRNQTPTEVPPLPSTSSIEALRKMSSSASLASAADIDPGRDARYAMSITPPPVLALSRSSDRSFETCRDTASVYSQDERQITRPSTSFSVSAGSYSRPSESDPVQDDQRSPTVSAFNEAYTGPTRSRSLRSLPPYSTRTSVDQHSLATSYRHGAISPPPPRPSFSQTLPLAPPPRASSLHHHRPIGQGHRPVEAVMEILEPGPSSPPLPASHDHPDPSVPFIANLDSSDDTDGARLSLQIPRTAIPPSIRSAPATSSQPSFFDSIQAQPNAMDDLDSSSEESDDDSFDDDDTEEGIFPYVNPDFRRPRTASVTVSSSPKPPFMRLGNHSAPYIAGASDPSRMPVGNIAEHGPPAPFFTKKIKSDAGHSPLSSTLELSQYAKRANQAGRQSYDITASRPGPSNLARESGEQSRRPVPDSFKKLDGMLLQHMEEEKDRIKKIATVHSKPKRPKS